MKRKKKKKEESKHGKTWNQGLFAQTKTKTKITNVIYSGARKIPKQWIFFKYIHTQPFLIIEK